MMTEIEEEIITETQEDLDMHRAEVCSTCGKNYTCFGRFWIGDGEICLSHIS